MSGRLTRRHYEDFNDEEREVFDRLAEGRKVDDGYIGGPFDVWLLNPEMGRRVPGLGGMFRFRTQVERRYVELAILMVGAEWQAQYEWWAHAPMAREAGLPSSVIDAIKAGRTPEFEDDGDRAAWQLIHELLATRQVADATFASAVAAFGERGVAELVNVAGYYTMVSMTLNTFQVPLPEGVQAPFEGGNHD